MLFDCRVILVWASGNLCILGGQKKGYRKMNRSDLSLPERLEDGEKCLRESALCWAHGDIAVVFLYFFHTFFNDFIVDRGQWSKTSGHFYAGWVISFLRVTRISYQRLAFGQYSILRQLISTLYNNDVLATGARACWRRNSNAKPLSFYGFICRLFNNIISTDGRGCGVVRSAVILHLFAFMYIFWRHCAVSSGVSGL